MLGAEAVILSLTESYKDALSWARHPRWHSLHLRGVCTARQIQVHWVTDCVYDQWVVSMQDALSMAGTVSPMVGVHRCCGDNSEDWYAHMA